MKIELEYPFTEKWRLGYLVINKEPRRNIVLYNSQQNRTTISYARYLMSVHLKRFLSEDEHVDHVNGDKLDDRIENYQILSSRENSIKAVRQLGKERQFVELSCGVCGSVFEKQRNKTHLVIKKGSDYCSRSCAGKAKKAGKKSTVLREFRRGIS